MDDPLEAVRSAARLAHLKLSEAEVREAAPQLEAILSAFADLAQAPVEGLDPLVTPHPPEDGLRPDEPEASPPATGLLDNAPDAEGQLYRTPRAVE